MGDINLLDVNIPHRPKMEKLNIFKCSNPSKIFILDSSGDKKETFFTSYKVDHLEKIGSRIYKIFEKPTKFSGADRFNEYIEVPCHNCLACRIKHAADWSLRCYLESLYHDNNYFITLTYDDEHIHNVEYVNDDGEILELSTLVKDDFTNFIKDLRHKFDGTDIRIKFFGSGEYGDLGSRAHMHIILFGCPLIFDKYDLKVRYVDRAGFNHYQSNLLESIWSNGFIDVCDFSKQTAGYVARYTMKKLDDPHWLDYEKEGRIPPFLRMSNGIAKKFFYDHIKELYNEDGSRNVYYTTNNVPIYQIDYFDRLLEKENPELYEKVKVKSKLWSAANQEVLLTNQLDAIDNQLRPFLDYDRGDLARKLQKSTTSLRFANRKVTFGIDKNIKEVL